MVWLLLSARLGSGVCWASCCWGVASRLGEVAEVAGELDAAAGAVLAAADGVGAKLWPASAFVSPN